MEETYSFGYWVERRRKALDLTRAELADRVGCAVETIKKIERDERRPSRLIAELLSNALMVSEEEREHFLKAARGEQSVDRLGIVIEPVVAPAAPQNNLPPQSTPFIGREAELDEIGGLLASPDCRLLTLVGPGGIGKSRIALRAAEKLSGADFQGVYLVSLAGIHSADALPSAIASAIHLEMKGKVHPQLIHYLSGVRRGILLVLDNFEHLLGGTELVIEILQHAPLVKLLVTSRERLNIHSEWAYSIEGLAYPQSSDLEEISQCSAVQLFVQSARRISANFILDEPMMLDIARICRMVEGMPLAIELAASWTHVLSCQDILAELERDMGLLTSPVRDMPERHQNIRALFDHSWKFLTEPEQSVLRKLSVFPGEFDRAAAEKVACASLPILHALVDKSLLRMYKRAEGTQSYDLHGLARQYAAEKLLENGEEYANQVYACHLDYFLALAERAELELQSSESLFWLDWLERNYDNLRAAFSWAADPRLNQDGEKAQRLMGALWWFWCMRGHLDEACQWVERALSLPSASAASLAKATWVAGYLNFYHGNPALGRELLARGVDLCRALGTSREKDLSLALNFLGVEAGSRDDVSLAQSLFKESLEIHQRLGDHWGIAQSMLNLGGTASFLGNQEKARACYQEALAAAYASCEPSRVSLPLAGLGYLAAESGDDDQARKYFCQVLSVCRMFRFTWMSAEILAQMGNIESHQANPEKAARLWGASEAIYKAHGASDFQLQEAADWIQSARERLGELAFSSAWLEGQAMTMEQAIAYALEES